MRGLARLRRVTSMTINLHSFEAGHGEPLLLLHGGLMSGDPVWAGHPASYLTYLDDLAARFRVIAVDTRGTGKSPNPSGKAPTYVELADDVIAFIAERGLDRPRICGFSDGGMIATLVALRAPSSVRALVNDAGMDLIDPESPNYAMARQVFGGSPDATKGSPDAVASGMMAKEPFGFVRRLQADHAGAGGWRTAVETFFPRTTKHVGISFADLRGITAPALMLAGDRDFLVPVEVATACYRALPKGELAIIPARDHALSKAGIAATIDFLQRH